MVRLDGAALQNVGIDGALRQKLDALLLARLLFEYADELRADHFALLLGLRNTRKLIEEAVDGIHIHEIGVHLVAEHLHDLLGLALS